MFRQLIYYSKSSVVGSTREQLTLLREILDTAQKNNSQCGITGYLVFDQGIFLQILEGDDEQVSETFRNIEPDPRHTDVKVMEKRSVPVRQFSAWSMGGAMRTPELQGVFLRNGIGGCIDPANMTGVRAVQLALDLVDFRSDTKKVEQA